MNKENFLKLNLQASGQSTKARFQLAGLLSLLLSLSFAFSPVSQEAYADQAKPQAGQSKAKPEAKTDKKPAEKATDKDKSDKKDAADKAEKKDDKSKEAAASKPEPVIENVVAVTTDDLVEKPHNFMGKNVKFTCSFFAFSNLALDYKPAYRSAKTHISLLVSRDKKKVPLSELKLAMMTPKEKDPDTQLLTGLKEGDTLEITGKVFSTALDDPWVDILRMKKIGGSQDDKKADASSKGKGADSKADDGKSSEKNDKSGAAKGNTENKSGGKN